MTNTQTGDPMKLDRADADVVLFRVAMSAFTYHPNKHITEPGYTIDEDLDWCTLPLTALSAEERAAMRERIHAAITDPTADRTAFIDHLYSFADQTI